MLLTIGLRIERLLYLGFFLLLICALQVYLTIVAVHFSAKDTRALESLINVLEVNSSRLQSLYEKDSAFSRPSSDKEARVESMRQLLNLPPTRNIDFNDKSTYASEVQELLLKVPDWYSLRDQLDGVFTVDKEPKALIAALKEHQRRKMPEKGIVLGIETPRHLTLQYGSTDFRFSAQPLATGLLIALYPLVFVWLGSFYITRQRELVAIRKASDHKTAFPHILNFVVVDSSNFLKTIGLSVKQKDVRVNLVLTRIVTTSIRCIFVVMTVLPLIAGIGYSSVQVSTLLELPGIIDILIAIAFFALSLLGILAILQEAITLHGKTFYE